MINRIIFLSVERRWLVLGLTVLLSLWGAWSFHSLPIDAVPDITNVQVQINTVSKGLSPEDLESKVTRPIELAMNGIPGIREVRSLTKFGLSQVTLVFEDDTDIYRNRQMVGERLQGLTGLPSGVETPSLGPISTGLGEIYHYTLRIKQPKDEVGDLMRLRELQEWTLKPILQTVPGVAEVNSIGGLIRQLQVQPDLRKMARKRVSLAELTHALEETNHNVGGGAIRSGDKQLLVQAVGQFANPEQVRATPVKTLANFQNVTVGDIAEVRFAPALRTGAALVDGRQALLGTVMMLSGANSRTVARAVADKVAEIRAQHLLGDEVEIVTLYNRADLVDATLGTVKHNLAIGAALVMVILFLLLGNLKAAFIVSVSIPVTLLGTFGFMRVFNISGNLMSLGALDFGIIVDAAVIVVDRCVSWLQDKKRHGNVKEKIVAASQEIRSAAGFGQIMVIVAFIPILGLTGIEGKMFRPMAQTFSIALAVALVLSFTFIPALSALLFSDHESDKIPWIMRRIEVLYTRTLGLALRWKGLVFAASAASVVVATVLFLRLGAEFLPKLDEGSLVVQVTRDPAISLEKSVEMQSRTEQALLRHPAVARVFSRIGTPEIATDPMGANEADTFVELKDKTTWTDGKRRLVQKNDLIANILDSVHKAVGDQELSATQPIQMRFNDMLEGTKSDLTLKVYGHDLKSLKTDAEKLATLIASVPGSGDVQPDVRGSVPLLVLEPNVHQLKAFGISAGPVLDAVQTALAGRVVGQFYEGQLMFPLVVRLAPEQRDNLETVRNVAIAADSSLTLPLQDFVNFRANEIISPIYREFGRRRAAVLINLRGRDVQSFVTEAQTRIANAGPLSSGNTLEWFGAFRSLEQAKARLAWLGPLALLLVVGMLFNAFRDVKETLIVLVTVPLALVGGVLGLWLTGTPFSISTAVGFIALIGIAVLNGVVMIHFYKEIEFTNSTAKDWIIPASVARLRAVLMTALVDVFGFIPMAASVGVGSEVQRPLAVVIIGGILTSTALTLIVLPLLASVWIKPRNA